MTFEELLAVDGKLIYKNAGNSMTPMIREGKDLLLIKPVSGRLKRLDIPLYKRDNGQYVLHRVIKVRKSDYVLCGDNQFVPEYGVRDSQIIGVLTAVIRDGKETSIRSFRWRLFGLIWYLLLPLRAFTGKSMSMMKRAASSHNPLSCFFRSCSAYLGKKRNKKMHDQIDSVLADFGVVPSGSIRWRLIYDHYRYRIDYREYFLYDFAHLNAAGKREYIGNYERNELIRKLSRRPDDRKQIGNLTKNKYLTYLLLKDFYRREVLFLNKEEDYDAFADFLRRKQKVILKPQGASLGEDVRLVSLSEISDTREYFHTFLKVRSWIAEEVVAQTEEMAEFHPASVNTVRLVTLLYQEQVIFLFGCLRMGTGDNVVDNTSHGGLGAAIDVDTGIVISAGMDKKGHSFLHHPDTGKQIIGFVIPRYEELKAMAVELAHLMSEIKYIAWDFALTSDGWCLIEANSSGHLTNQAREKRGYRKLFEQYYQK